MFCINCNLCIKGRICRHNTVELPSAMYNVLKSWIAPIEIPPSSIICDQCYDILYNINYCVNSETPTRMFGHNNVCPGCGISMNRIRIHKLPADCEERKAISSWSSPVITRQLDYVCYTCWTRASRSTQRYHDSSKIGEVYHDSSKGEGYHDSSKGEGYHDSNKGEGYHDNSKKERFHDSNKGERYHDSSREESALVKPSLDTLAEYTCEECCATMIRRRSKKTCMGCGVPITNDSTRSDEANCGSSLRQRTDDQSTAGTHMFDFKESIRQELCTRYSGSRNLAASIEANREDSIEPVSSKAGHPRTATLTMPNYKRVAAGSRRCLFRDCPNRERHSVPLELRERLLLDFSLYIPKDCTLCSDHLDSYGCWRALSERDHSRQFTSSQVEDMLAMTRECALRPYNFANVKYMRPELCQYWLGITAEEFYEMLDGLPLLKSNVKPELSLAVYLLKRKTGESNSRLSMLLDVPLSTLECYLQTAHRCLEAAKATRAKEQ